MTKLINEKFELTGKGIEIQDEFENLIKPFYEKYAKDVSPVEFEWLINVAIQMKNASNYADRVISFYK